MNYCKIVWKDLFSTLYVSKSDKNDAPYRPAIDKRLCQSIHWLNMWKDWHIVCIYISVHLASTDVFLLDFVYYVSKVCGNDEKKSKFLLCIYYILGPIDLEAQLNFQFKIPRCIKTEMFIFQFVFFIFYKAGTIWLEKPVSCQHAVDTLYGSSGIFAEVQHIQWV